MRVTPLRVPGVLLCEPKVFADDRGYFSEVWHAERYAAAGIPTTFVQDNVSFSKRGVLRGLHYQWPSVQGKLVSVLSGSVFDVAVDVRVGSPTFGQWVGETLSADNHRQMWIPEGFAHGFIVLSEVAVFHYKVTAFYAHADEVTLAWNDPRFGIEWPIAEPVLAPRDAAAPHLAAIPPERLPTYSR